MTTAEDKRRRSEEPFVLTAMFSLVMSSLWTAAHPALLLQFFYSPPLLALTHFVTLGFITSMMMGVLLRITPMALGVEPRSHWLATTQYVLFAIGASGMVVHFGIAHWRGLAWSTLMVLAAALVQAWNLSGVFRKAWEGSWVARYMAAALVHLVLAAALGAAYGLQNGYGIGARVLRMAFVPRISAHFHLAAVGWVTTMIFGLELKLVPTTATPARFIPLRFALLQGGLLGLVASLLFGLGLETPFAIALLIAVAWQALEPLRTVRRHPDWAPEAAALGLLVLLAATGTALVLGYPDPDSPYRFRVELAYGYAGLLGWVTLTVAATAFKLFPLWVWRERFAADWGKKPVPSVVSLWSRDLRTVSTLGLAAGVLATAAGIVLESLPVLRVSLWVVFAGVLAFAVNFVRVARWALLPLEYRPPPQARLPRRGDAE